MLKILFIFLLSVNVKNGYAINLKSLGAQLTNSVDAKQIVNSNSEKIASKVEEIVKDKIEEYDSRVNNLIKKAETAVQEGLSIKDKVHFYIKMAKIVAAIAGSASLVLLLMLWRIWRNILSFKKLVRNVSNYDDFNKRLKALEEKMQQKQ